MAMEGLRTQVDALVWEKTQLETELRKLREAKPEEAAMLQQAREFRLEIEELTRRVEELPRLEMELNGALQKVAQLEGEKIAAEEELQRQKQQCEQAASGALARDEANKGQLDAAEQKTRTLEEALHRVRDECDLRHYRSTEEERGRWVDRERELLERLRTPACGDGQLTELREELATERETSGERLEAERLKSDELTAKIALLQAQLRRAGCESQTATPTGNGGAGTDSRPPPLTPADGRTSEPTLNSSSNEHDQLAQALLANQLPPIPKYTGEERNHGAETFGDWREQFEMVASLGRWDERTKLVNLVTRLKGQAFAFYRSCTLPQRASYDVLVKELERRFMPVELPAVQTSLFHDRKQKPREPVDDFAQDLRRLFYRAYPKAQQGSPEAEEMGRAVLANQFVNGLATDLKTKMTGKEGDLSKLLAIARFEEAKIREVIEPARRTASGSRPPQYGPPAGQNRPPDRGNRPYSGPPRNRPPIGGQQSKEPPAAPVGSNRYQDFQCYACGQMGHKAARCPHAQASGQREARGPPTNQRPPHVAAVVEGDGKPCHSDDHTAEMESALDQVSATMHGLTPAETADSVRLGPTLTSKVEVEGASVDALLDSGSPVTIVSLGFVLKVFAEKKPNEQTRDQWKAEMRERITRTAVKLRTYGGETLALVGEVTVSMRRGEYHTEATILVQNKAPVEVLLGTDLLPKLGFALMEHNPDQPAIDLMNNSLGRIHNGEPSLDLENPTPDGETEPAAIVRLLHAVRVPAGHKKIVKASIEGLRCRTHRLFEPTHCFADQRSLTMAEALVEPDEDNTITLILENADTVLAPLEEGQILGTVAMVDLKVKEEEEPVTRGQAVIAHTQLDALKDTDTRIQLIRQQVHLPSEGLTPNQLSQMENLLETNQDLFALSGSELGTTDLVQHSINTGDHHPIRQPGRRTPFAVRRTIEDLTEDMLQQGVIQHSHSPWASPVVLVKKRDGSVRFCVDYRRLNSVTKMDVFPLPRIDDTLELLSKAKYFTTLDLASGYWQVEMNPDSQEKTAFVTHSGLYEFKKMPFGLCNAPATFQRLMEAVLQGLARRTCMIYLDDILVFSETFEEHVSRLEEVFDRLRRAGLRLKPKKCTFVRPEVHYLGHVVSAGGIAVDPAKVEAIENFAPPTNPKSLRSFLGLASYYRRFVPSFSKVAGPLYSLLKKDAAFQWTSDCQRAFDTLRDLLVNTPILAFPDFSEDFLLETDASRSGLGAVLAQKVDGLTRPVAYASRTLQPHEANYGATELEALGVVWAVKHFRPYLYGHRCEVYTDHSALKALLNTPQPSGKLARWGLVLQDLDLHIHHRAGKRNANADCLSRYPIPHEPLPEGDPFAVIAAVDISDIEPVEPKLPSLQRGDPALREVIHYLENGVLPSDEHRARELTLTKNQYELVDETLYHLEADKTLRIVLPEASRQEVFEEVHGGRFGGHLRDAKIHGALSKHYWWPTMRSDIRKWCLACITCASRRVGRMARPPLTPIPVGGPFDRVGVDIIQFPLSYDGHQYAIVFMDYLTKWPEVFAIPDQTALTVARALVEGVISRHGVPSELLSDRGRNFLSGLMAEVYELMGIRKKSTTSYHPQSDGLVERFNRTLTDMLSKVVDKQGRDWDKHLPYVLFAYRACPQESTKESPFFLLYGRDPALPTEEALTQPKTRYQVDLTDYRADLTDGLTTAWSLAREQIQKSQHKQKKYYDRSASASNLQVGDRVFLYVPSAKAGKAHKFARPFHGPYRVLELTPNDARIIPVHRPKDEPIFVALDRIRRCPSEISTEDFWPMKTRKRTETPHTTPAEHGPSPGPSDPPNWSGRLRSRT